MSYTILQVYSTSLKIQRSEFIAFLYPTKTVEIAKARFSAHQTEYQNATHNCYAYIVGENQQWQYYSDQGEPSGTAGKPILNTLMKHQLTNILAVVTRYYGGVKLGVRGLIDAYSAAVEAAVTQAVFIEFIVKSMLTIECEYAILDSLKYLLHKNGAELNVLEYGTNIKAELIYPDVSEQIIQNLMSDLTIKGHVKKFNP